MNSVFVTLSVTGVPSFQAQSKSSTRTDIIACSDLGDFPPVVNQCNKILWGFPLVSGGLFSICEAPAQTLDFICLSRGKPSVEKERATFPADGVSARYKLALLAPCPTRWEGTLLANRCLKESRFSCTAWLSRPPLCLAAGPGAGRIPTPYPWPSPPVHPRAAFLRSRHCVRA